MVFEISKKSFWIDYDKNTKYTDGTSRWNHSKILSITHIFFSLKYNKIFYPFQYFESNLISPFEPFFPHFIEPFNKIVDLTTPFNDGTFSNNTHRPLSTQCDFPHSFIHFLRPFEYSPHNIPPTVLSNLTLNKHTHTHPSATTRPQRRSVFLSLTKSHHP